jgi:hypothetical protein
LEYGPIDGPTPEAKEARSKATEGGVGRCLEGKLTRMPVGRLSTAARATGPSFVLFCLVAQRNEPFHIGRQHVLPCGKTKALANHNAWVSRFEIQLEGGTPVRAEDRLYMVRPLDKGVVSVPVIVCLSVRGNHPHLVAGPRQCPFG